MAKDTFWFRHDSNAARDPKILMMRSIWGYEGYGMFWAIIEYLRDQEDYTFKVSEKYGYTTLAGALNCDPKKFSDFIEDLVNEFELLSFKDGFLFSESLKKRMHKWDVNKANGAKGGRPKKTQTKPKPKPKQNPNHNPNETQTETQSKPLREEKRREENKREEKNTIPPTLEQIKARFQKMNYPLQEAEKFFNFYESKGWLVGKVKMKNWHASSANWNKGKSNAGTQQNISHNFKANIPDYRND